MDADYERDVDVEATLWKVCCLSGEFELEYFSSNEGKEQSGIPHQIQYEAIEEIKAVDEDKAIDIGEAINEVNVVGRKSEHK